MRRVWLTFELKGIVQGVGFRPAVWRMACEAGLGGWIKNVSGKVLLRLEGEEERIKTFMSELPGKAPRNSKIEAIRLVDRDTLVPDAPVSGFRIMDSCEAGERDVVIPPDLALCRDCERDILDPENRRFAYPFTTCTACGPRYTIVHQTPYDRPRTTMSAFPLCHDCRAEYDNPRNRRFRAETIACPKCGPQLFLANNTGAHLLVESPLKAARLELASGRILAVRSIGGFHLAADAFDRAAIETLRKRKRRPCKPFAVMMRDIETVKAYCHCPEAAERLLLSAESPIVILDVKEPESFPRRLPVELLCPDSPTLGAMLPVSPLHKLLFERMLKDDPTPPFDMLVMTSGNRGGEPVCISNEEAFECLSGIADTFLCHDREINLRNDDSLCALRDGAPQVWRRARGYAPSPVILKTPLKRAALAMGAELKSSVAFAYGDRIVPSPHIGDLDNPEAIKCLVTMAECLPQFLDRIPEAVATDMHPDLHSTLEGAKLAQKYSLPLVKVQHHHAHALSCMAEHGLDRALALVFDGTGYGPDGKIWGAELLDVRTDSFRRLATFAPAPLPGGDTATSRPARQLIGRFQAAGMGLPAEWLKRLGLDEAEPQIWLKQCERKLNSPASHAAGRLFDSVAALLGLAPDFIDYDGQPAMRLETAAARCKDTASIPEDVRAMFSFKFREEDGLGLIDWTPLFQAFPSPDAITPSAIPQMAMAFHLAVASAAGRMLEETAANSGCQDVVLSGGVFMNGILSTMIPKRLSALGFKPHIHRLIPPNDGGVCVGQALCAGMR